MNDSVTLADIAAATGFSVGTVSKALRGRGQLSRQTRSAVLKAASELGFRGVSDSVLAPGSSYLVGLLTTDAFGRFTIPILTGAEDTFAQGQMSILLAESRGDPIRERYYLQTLKGRQVDGIIVAGRSSDPRSSLTSLLDVPVVYALAPSDDPSDVSIVPNDEGGAERAVNHLLSTGRKSVAVVAGPRYNAASRSRVAGAARALEQWGLPIVTGDALYGEWSERWGYEAANNLIDHYSLDGVLCASDQIARGFLECLRDRGVPSPDQVGVVGMDNWGVMVEAARPSITSVDLNLDGVGRRAAELLVKMISGVPVSPGVNTVDCELVPRQST